MAVYFLLDRGNQRIKIGFTENFDDRYKAHLTSNPGLEILGLIDSGNRRMEQSFHRLMRGHRCPGTTEWYKDSKIAREVLFDVWTRVGREHNA